MRMDVVFLVFTFCNKIDRRITIFLYVIGREVKSVPGALFSTYIVVLKIPTNCGKMPSNFIISMSIRPYKAVRYGKNLANLLCGSPNQDSTAAFLVWCLFYEQCCCENGVITIPAFDLLAASESGAPYVHHGTQFFPRWRGPQITLRYTRQWRKLDGKISRLRDRV